MIKGSQPERVPERGCGFRVKGGIYAESRLSMEGYPLEHFLFCKPIRFSRHKLGVTDKGVKIIERVGVNHIVDVIGKGYPYVPDFLEEVRRFGLSRRLSSSLNFASLSPASTILVAHKIGWIDEAYSDSIKTPRKDIFGGIGITFRDIGYSWDYCPREIEGHNQAKYDDEMCSGLWWQNIPQNDTDYAGSNSHGDFVRIRTMPSFRYQVIPLVRWHVYESSEAFVAAFPITHLAVVNDPDTGKHENAMKKASKSSIPVELVNE